MSRKPSTPEFRAAEAARGRAYYARKKAAEALLSPAERAAIRKFKSDKNREQYLKRREKHNAAGKAWRKANRAKVRRYNANYYAANVKGTDQKQPSKCGRRPDGGSMGRQVRARVDASIESIAHLKEFYL